jgi:hypothetical protein
MHKHDDYFVAVYKPDKLNDIAGWDAAFHTPWLFRAIWKYIQFSFEYPKQTIVFRHNRYY